jgi:hypothetical protein
LLYHGMPMSIQAGGVPEDDESAVIKYFDQKEKMKAAEKPFRGRLVVEKGKDGIKHVVYKENPTTNFAEKYFGRGSASLRAVARCLTEKTKNGLVVRIEDANTRAKFAALLSSYEANQTGFVKKKIEKSVKDEFLKKDTLGKTWDDIRDAIVPKKHEQRKEYISIFKKLIESSPVPDYMTFEKSLPVSKATDRGVVMRPGDEENAIVRYVKQRIYEDFVADKPIQPTDLEKGETEVSFEPLTKKREVEEPKLDPWVLLSTPPSEGQPSLFELAGANCKDAKVLKSLLLRIPEEKMGAAAKIIFAAALDHQNKKVIRALLELSKSLDLGISSAVADPKNSAKLEQIKDRDPGLKSMIDEVELRAREDSATQFPKHPADSQKTVAEIEKTQKDEQCAALHNFLLNGNRDAVQAIIKEVGDQQAAEWIRDSISITFSDGSITTYPTLFHYVLEQSTLSAVRPSPYDQIARDLYKVIKNGNVFDETIQEILKAENKNGSKVTDYFYTFSEGHGIYNDLYDFVLEYMWEDTSSLILGAGESSEVIKEAYKKQFVEMMTSESFKLGKALAAELLKPVTIQSMQGKKIQGKSLFEQIMQGGADKVKQVHKALLTYSPKIHREKIAQGFRQCCEQTGNKELALHFQKEINAIKEQRSKQFLPESDEL